MNYFWLPTMNYFFAFRQCSQSFIISSTISDKSFTLTSSSLSLRLMTSLPSSLMPGSTLIILSAEECYAEPLNPSISLHSMTSLFGT